MTGTFVPPWGRGVCMNYRQQFKAKFGRETTLTEQDIWDIFNSVFDDNSNAKQDELRVEEMGIREKVTVQEGLDKIQKGKGNDSA